jgi:excisionase family DNA binding protein
MRLPKEPTITHAEALAFILIQCRLGPEHADSISRVLWRLAPERLTIREAASRFGVSTGTIMRFYKAGKLPACNFGLGTTRYYLFSPSELAECFQTSTSGTSPASEGSGSVKT